jgi:hypothetical protein
MDTAMKFLSFAAIALIASTSCSASLAQVYKCKGAGGAVEIQQTLCLGQGDKLNVRPASGHANYETAEQTDKQIPTAKPPPASGVESRMANALQEERLRKEGWYEMNGKRLELEKVVAQCQSEQRQIESEKVYSKNNLAGATRDVSISNKMQAAASMCDSKIRNAERTLDRATAECDKIKCIKPN